MVVIQKEENMKGKILLIFGIFLMLIIEISITSAACISGGSGWNRGCISATRIQGVTTTGSYWEENCCSGLYCCQIPGSYYGCYSTSVQCACVTAGLIWYNGACCTPETESDFCTRNNKNCGSFTGTDCGIQRTVDCGTCPSSKTCSAGTCVDCVACPSGTTQCSGTQIQTCGNYGNGCTQWSSPTNCPSGQTCQNGQCRLVTAGLCSQYSNLWKKFERNETGGHDACLSPYNNCILSKIGSNLLFDHYCSGGNTIPIYRTMNISMKINLGGNLREKLATD